jgi:hypothetical protein
MRVDPPPLPGTSDAPESPLDTLSTFVLYI